MTSSNKDHLIIPWFGKSNVPSRHKSKTSKIIFILSILTAVYWCFVMFVDVYRFVVVGAIYELAWLPMLLCVYSLPIVSFIFFYKEKFSLRSLNLFAFLISVATLLFVLLSN